MKRLEVICKPLLTTYSRDVLFAIRTGRVQFLKAFMRFWGMSVTWKLRQGIWGVGIYGSGFFRLWGFY